MNTEFINMPPGKYHIEIIHTAPNGRKSKLTIHEVFASEPQRLEFNEEHTDLLADDKVVKRLPQKLLHLEFDDVTVLEKDGGYFTVEEVMG